MPPSSDLPDRVTALREQSLLPPMPPKEQEGRIKISRHIFDFSDTQSSSQRYSPREKGVVQLFTASPRKSPEEIEMPPPPTSSNKMYQRAISLHLKEKKKLRHADEIAMTSSIISGSSLLDSLIDEEIIQTKSPMGSGMKPRSLSAPRPLPKVMNDHGNIVEEACPPNLRRPSHKTARRLQEGLDRSYPMSRMDMKKRKEARFDKFSRKLQIARRGLPLNEIESRIVVKSEGGGNLNSGASKPPASVSPLGRATSPSSSAFGHAKRGEQPPKPGAYLDLARAPFNCGSCSDPILDDDLTLNESLTSRVESDSSSPSSNITKSELLKLKMELRRRKELLRAKRKERSEVETTPHEEREVTETVEESPRAERESAVLPSPPKSVRFSDQLITEVRERPYTDPEDIGKLYFAEEELDELELDRATVEGDQFELIANGTDAKVTISVCYKNKRNTLHNHHIDDFGTIDYTPSDLSALCA